MTGRDLADNTFLMVAGRFAMLGAAGALPVVGWLLIRGINGVDDLSRKIDIIHDRVLETQVTVKLIGERESDHEDRLRALERMTRSPGKY